MFEIFRKHYSYGETIPIVDTHVAMTVDIFETPGKTSSNGPSLKAVCLATAGPMKALPIVVEPLHNDSKIVHLKNIPVPIPEVRTIDISLVFDFANFRWTPSQEGQKNGGLVTFDLNLRAAFSLLGKSYTLQLDQRSCAITAGTISEIQRDFRPQQPERAQERMAGPLFEQLDLEERLRQISTQLLTRA